MILAVKSIENDSFVLLYCHSRSLNFIYFKIKQKKKGSRKLKRVGKTKTNNYGKNKKEKQ